MVSKTFFAAAVGIAAVNAQCQLPLPAANQLPGNSIFTPDGSNTPTIGQPFQVTYDGTGLGQTLRFILYRGPGNALVQVGPIADVANCGSARCAFTWTPAANLEPDTSRYGLQLIDLSTCKFQYTTQFGLNAGAVRPSSALPSASAAPSGSVLPPRPSGSSLPPLPPRPSGSIPPPGPSGRPSGAVPPPPAASDDCDEPGKPGQGGSPGTGGQGQAPGGFTPPAGGYYPNGNGTYSNGTGNANPTYRPLQSNDGARMAISAFGAIVAFAAAIMVL